MASFTIYVSVQNAHGLFASSSTSLEVTGVGYLPPVIDSVDISPPTGPYGTLFTITVNAHDQNDPPSPLNYNVNAFGDGSYNHNINGNRPAQRFYMAIVT